MIWQLLKRNISRWQIGGYAVATLVGLVIVMAAVQFYLDLGAALGARPGDGISLMSPRNLVISKPVGLHATLTGRAPAFSQNEIDEIASQPWTSGVSPFQASDFGVRASAEMGGRGLTTAMFFESIPERLIDKSVDGFTFDPDDPEIPIVLSKDYLSLYNFGFAASAGIPMVSEGVISSIPLTVTLSGNGHHDSFRARIAGFSSWLNTIAVPQSFMDWAHARYGTEPLAAPSRLIVEVTDPADPAMQDFMSDNGYEIAGPDDNSGRAASLLKLVSGVVASVGGVITLLALFILVLSLFLLIQKNRSTITGLLLLGYRPARISAAYITLVAIVNGAVLLLGVTALLLLQTIWTPAVTALRTDTGGPWLAAAAGAGLMIAITAINALIIRRLVRK